MTTPQVAAQRLSENRPGPGRFPARAGGSDEPVYQAPLHAQPEHEAWYVLEGTLAVRVGDHVHQVSAGGAVIVPGGTAHIFWNPCLTRTATCSSWARTRSR